jgi:hypothetical protein
MARDEAKIACDLKRKIERTSTVSCRVKRYSCSSCTGRGVELHNIRGAFSKLEFSKAIGGRVRFFGVSLPNFADRLPMLGLIATTWTSAVGLEMVWNLLQVLDTECCDLPNP